MDAVLLCLVLAMFCCGVIAAICGQWIRTCSVSGIFVAAVAVTGLIAVTLVGSVVVPGTSFEKTVWSLLQEGKPKSLLVAFAGLICGLVWGGQSVLAQAGRRTHFASFNAIMGTSVAVAIGLLLAWDDAFDIERSGPLDY